MKYVRKLGLVASLSMAASATALADLPAPGEVTVGDGFKMSGLLDTYFEYNFKSPPNSSDPTGSIPQNRLRAYDTAHEQFILNAAEIGIHHETNPVGLDLVFGSGPQLAALNGVGTAFSSIRTASIHYSTGGWVFTVGHFDAGFGFEAIDAPLNMNYSHSFISTLIQPQTYTGLKAAHSFGDGLSTVLGVVNGINRFTDNNRGKTFFGQLQWVQGPFTTELSYTVGPEMALDSRDWRHSLDINVRDEISDTLRLGLDTTFVRGANDVIDGNGDHMNSIRAGAAAYVSKSFCQSSWDTFRLGWLRDAQGAATQTGQGVSLYDVTLTHKQMMTKNLSGWVEFRYDGASSENLFYNNSANSTNINSKNQITGTLAATLQI